MNEQFKKIFDDCGIYISPYNMDANMKEIDFLCERIVLKCALICEHNETMTGKELSTAIMDEFGLKFVKCAAICEEHPAMSGRSLAT